MGKTHKQYSPTFKAKIALEAIKEEETIIEVASRYGVHPTQIKGWKKTATGKLLSFLKVECSYWRPSLLQFPSFLRKR